MDRGNPYGSYAWQVLEIGACGDHEDCADATAVLTGTIRTRDSALGKAGQFGTSADFRGKT